MTVIYDKPVFLGLKWQFIGKIEFFKFWLNRTILDNQTAAKKMLQLSTTQFVFQNVNKHIK